jgi:signal transduction histidine kinase
MASDSPLRRRLALLLVITGALAALLLPFTFWLTHSSLQTAATQDLLAYELISMSHSQSPPIEVDTGRSHLRYYRRALAHALPLPPELEQLGPGWYRNLRIGNRRFAVQVRELADGDRGYLAYDIGFITEMEFGMWMFVMSLAAMLGLMSWVLARRMVDRALNPFTQLLRDILALTPGRGGQRIDTRIRDREFAVILDALNRYLAQIDTLVERERTFAAAASHELRTPLTVIQGAASSIDQIPEVPERVRRRLGRAVMELRHDLDALLGLSQAQDPPAAQDLQLDTWLPELAESHVAVASPAATLTWAIEAPVLVRAPPGVLGIVFSNLLRNAVRAARGGAVSVKVQADRIVVSDSGPGIPADELANVFKPRFRGHDGGSGMGLYIAKTLAQRQGWAINIVNQPQGGVSATLLLRPSAAAHDDPASA